tara:strand:+ start:397 stop:819 length:423 start_codon:yes stop_codon:yes gene_type:complete
MPILAALPAAAGVVGGFFARKAVKKYTIIGGKVVIGYFLGTELLGYVDEETGESIDELEDTLIEAGLTIAEGVAEETAGLSLALIEGFGSAVVRGIELTYDTVREKLRGKEDDVIAGFTVGFMAVLTLVFLYQSAKKGGA